MNRLPPEIEERAINHYLPQFSDAAPCRFCYHPIELNSRNLKASPIFPQCQFLFCRNPECGFVSAFPYSYDDDRAYQNNYDCIRVDPQWSNYDYLKTTVRYNAEIINHCFHAEKINHHFEIGCFSGFLMGALRDLNPQWKTTGLELNRYAVQMGREKGEQIIEDSILRYQPTETYGSVGSREVIEHFWDFHAHMRLVKKLNPDILWIQTPIQNENLEETIAFQPYHLSLFSEQNLKDLVKAYGFEVSFLMNNSGCGVLKAVKH